MAQRTVIVPLLRQCFCSGGHGSCRAEKYRSCGSTTLQLTTKLTVAPGLVPERCSTAVAHKVSDECRIISPELGGRGSCRARTAASSEWRVANSEWQMVNENPQPATHNSQPILTPYALRFTPSKFFRRCRNRGTSIFSAARNSGHH
jgi:hypothetical protein